MWQRIVKEKAYFTGGSTSRSPEIIVLWAFYRLSYRASTRNRHALVCDYDETATACGYSLSSTHSPFLTK